MITREKQILAYPKLFRRQVASGDADALIQLKHITSTWTGSFSTHHVKSHQDKTTPYSQLSPDAQLNFHADALATEAL